MFDRYPYVVECKGGSRQLLAKTLVITTTLKPEDLCMEGTWRGEKIDQLLRRVELCHDMSDGLWPPPPWPARKQQPMDVAEINIDEMVNTLIGQEEDIVQ